MSYTVGVKLTVKTEAGPQVTVPAYLNPLGMCDALSSVSTLTSQLGLLKVLGIVEDFSIAINSEKCRSAKGASP